MDRKLLHIEEIYANRLTIAGIAEKLEFGCRDFVMNMPLELPGSFATTPCEFREPVAMVRNQDCNGPLEVISMDDIDRV